MSRKKTKEEFIEKANIIHKNKYDYSLVEYVNNKTKVKIICPRHGLFEQLPNDHENGRGCKKCADEYVSELFSMSKEEFIKRANNIHDNKYDYSLVEYKNDKTKIKIICPRHGMFEQTPASHLSESGCKECGNENKKISDKQIFASLPETFKNYIILEKEKHTCNYLIQGECVFCGNKKQKIFSSWKYDDSVCDCQKDDYFAEKQTEIFLKNHNFQFERRKTFPTLKDKKMLSFDFHVPSVNLLIECQGEQHYRSKNFGGCFKDLAEKNFKIQQYHDLLKRKFTKENGIDLLEISFKDFHNIGNILEKKILKKF